MKSGILPEYKAYRKLKAVITFVMDYNLTITSHDWILSTVHMAPTIFSNELGKAIKKLNLTSVTIYFLQHVMNFRLKAFLNKIISL